MPGYTPNHNIPYPLPGDPIYLGAAQQKALAEGVEAALAAHGVPPVAQSNPLALRPVASRYRRSRTTWTP